MNPVGTIFGPLWPDGNQHSRGTMNDFAYLADKCIDAGSRLAEIGALQSPDSADLLKQVKLTGTDRHAYRLLLALAESRRDGIKLTDLLVRAVELQKRMNESSEASREGWQ